MPLSITLPDDLASQWQQYEHELPQILALGLREWNARQETGFVGLNSVLETLATLPAPEEVLALRPSPTIQARIEELLEKNRSSGLSPEEQREWDRYRYVEHLVRLAKAQAVLKLKGS
jgi:hypothetical protein